MTGITTVSPATTNKREQHVILIATDVSNYDNDWVPDYTLKVIENNILICYTACESNRASLFR